MEAKHTPTPWHVECCTEGPSCWCRLIFADVDDVEGDKAIITSGSLRAHNAEFIVRACNSHDALVEALKWYVKHDYTTQEGHEFWLAGKAAAIEALALAGETP